MFFIVRVDSITKKCRYLQRLWWKCLLICWNQRKIKLPKRKIWSRWFRHLMIFLIKNISNLFWSVLINSTIYKNIKTTRGERLHELFLWISAIFFWFPLSIYQWVYWFYQNQQQKYRNFRVHHGFLLLFSYI